MVDNISLIPYRLGDYWGFSDRVGKIVIPCTFDFVYPFADHIATVQMNYLWGAINLTGQLIIPCVYERPLIFKEGFAGANRPGDKIAFIREDGHPLTNFRLDKVYPFENGLAIVSEDGEAGVIDSNAKVVIDFEFDDLLPFSDKAYRFNRDGKWGLIDKHGNEIIPAKYTEIMDLSEGIAQVEGEESYGEIDYMGDPDDEDTEFEQYESTRPAYGYIDQNGIEVSNCKYSFSSRFNEGFGSLQIHDDGEGPAWFFVNKNGKQLKDLYFSSVKPFSNGFSVVKRGLWGIINKTGTWLIEPHFDDITNISEGVFMCAKISEDESLLTWKCIDTNGNELFSVFNYTFIGPFSDGIAHVEKGELSGYIDIKGNEIIPCIYDSGEDFKNGLARVRKGNGES